MKQKFLETLEKTVQEYDKLDRFGFIGLIGSVNPKHDIDMLFLPNPKYKNGEFIKSQMELLGELKENLKRVDSDLVPFPSISVQDEVEYLSNRKKSEILFHNLVFLDNPGFVKYNPLGFRQNIRKNMQVVYGDLKILDDNSLRYEHPLGDDYYLVINNHRHVSNYPKDLLSKKTKHICDFILRRHNIKSGLRESKAVLSQQECKKLYLDVLDYLDSRIKN